MMPMEELFFSNSALLAAAAILFSVFLLLSKPRRREPYVPEAKGAWPFIGHLHLLAGPVPPHLVLGKMADRHGAIFAIRMGVHKALVVNSWEIARECLTTNDKVLATRPRSVASEVLSYDYAMFGIAPYGEYWRSVRRMVMTEVLSNRRLALLQHVRESEVQASIEGLYDHWKENNGQPVEMKKVFGDIVLNIIFRMIVGKRYEDEKDEQARKALRVFFESMGKFLLSDALPYLRWLDIGGHEKEMRDTARELDRAVQGWLDEHRSRRKLEGKRKGEDEDFMDIMISTIDEGRGEQFTDYDADTVIKSTSMVRNLNHSQSTWFFT
ncbi:hypothetical protein MLD38_012939 [Melastoma candidum]|uniref:Uncharacterized protein n=1 Tax=Melastoma candidum TaxID=119954 RepID=A0ACB9R8K3_9MYRT|nr:hypothetical protein MLD38_012939 [Melastoma candidum]